MHDVNLDFNHSSLPACVTDRQKTWEPTQAETLNSDRFAHMDVTSSTQEKPGTQENGNAKENVEVDEDLFGDDDIDIGDIDEQLGDLAIEEAGMS